ncbi:MAG: acylphosphatase [Candidatus Omnitrophota bacterium]
MIQAHIYYAGLVQGVGFRYTVQKYASGLGLVGWVRNLSDGRVEILVEGPQETVGQLCREVEGHFGEGITDKEIKFHPASGGFKNFRIAF